MSNEAQYIYRNSSIICIGNTHTHTRGLLGIGLKEQFY